MASSRSHADPPSQALARARRVSRIPPLPLLVLLVEDSPVTTSIVCRYLELASPDSSVECAGTLREALDRLAQDEFDLVITDLNLPDSSGLATLDRVVDATDRLVVVLTSQDEPDVEREAIARGVYDFLSKGQLSQRALGQVLRLATIQSETMRSLRRTTEERDARTRRIDFLTQNDRLTGLANRDLFCSRVGDAMDALRGDGSKLVIGLIDIERFRAVNEVLGTQAGDVLLREIAGRLARAAGVAASARVGPDVFAFIISPVRGVSEAERTARRVVRECVAEPFDVDCGGFEIAARVGLSRFPADGAQPGHLLSRAEDALRQAKEAGESLTFYAPEMTRWTTETVTLESRLRRAMEREEFELHYQPKVRADSGVIAGFEALLRWRSPEEGLVPPGRFIPLMEESGMILQAGDWALRRAVEDHGRWCLLGYAPPALAVNVSARQMRKRDFAERVLEALRASRLPGAPVPRIDLEITETCAMQDFEANAEKLRMLRQGGLRIAIDDFGTGYSSLAYLARLPVQQLKIDRSFVASMLGDHPTGLIVRSVVGLGRALGMEVVAEGVETEAQARRLRELGCDELQGFLLGRPVGFDDATRMLRAGAQHG